ncbi:histone H3-K4 methyltransferase Set1 [Eremomyces bilateralis CBS 781.70]|uniref:Histone-lysine N-methyltransferase, H3 lysine-4 specific n=1 Tax=Eremomyces bilateralis CBS 781.70 TaxID=1392243 RepID=A0A6G1GDN5_9PEZI|nr:histone H3-K4 methyltransferase Set1 [Eremomyces bilateralis CBS 781.70]KAF1816001.1 histone H3-K4 methyltransferase Set1 [Eremomyces bilateralis CBS 781.70]
MSRASGGSFADFFPNAPSVVQSKRLKLAQQPLSADPPVARHASQSDHADIISTTSATQSAFDGSSNSTKDQSNSRHTVEDDSTQRPGSGDLLNGVGSESSLTSTASSIFSQPTGLSNMPSNHGITTASTILTPVTNTTDSSPPGKAPSPSHKGSIAAKNTFTDPKPMQNGTHAFTPAHTPPDGMLPGPGEERGSVIVWDPELDTKLSSKERRKHRPKYKVFGTESRQQYPPPDPRLAIAGYTAGAFHKKNSPNKQRLRLAPYVVKPYAFDARTSIGPGPPTQIVVNGFDPFTSASQIKAVFGSYGEIAELLNQTDPATGSFLGICLIRYRDTKPLRGTPIPASQAARKAEKEGTGQRIGLKTVKVSRDPEGRRCRRMVSDILRRIKDEQEKEREREQKLQDRRAVSVAPSPTVPAPPPGAPKGPSGTGFRAPPVAPPVAPQPPQPPRRPDHNLIETESLLQTIKRRPYIFLAHCYVPVMGTTVPHMYKRFRMYDVYEIRADQTGYYITFDDSKRGEDECTRLFRECHLKLLFNYIMNMDCQPYGNPNYQRSPSPERAAAQAKARKEDEFIRKHDDADFEEEKKERADRLDPVKGAIEVLVPQLREMLLKDIKKRIIAPHLNEYLDPDRHVAKRQKLGISDPPDKASTRPTFQIGVGDESPSTPLSRHGFAGRSKPPFRRDHVTPKDRLSVVASEGNAFLDDRRRRIAQSRRRTQPLHRRLHDFYDSEDSDDEQSGAIRPESEEQESRSVTHISRSPSRSVFDADEDAPKRKRRRLDLGWGAESDDELLDAVARKTLGHLIHKEPEDMARAELVQVVSTLPRSSHLWKRAHAEISLRDRAAEDDELFFGLQGTKPATAEVKMDVEPADNSSTAIVEVKKPKKTKRPPKSRTRKEEKGEIETLEVQTQLHVEEHVIDSELPTPQPSIEGTQKPKPRQRRKFNAKAFIKGSRTVDDGPNVFLDLDGWQSIVRDVEDMRYLSHILLEVAPTNLGDIELWAWREKMFKSLHNDGQFGVTSSPPTISGYYVPNPTGCARTEGVKKIAESEKSKYLPHRIRVAQQQAERAARAEKDPQYAADAARQAAAAKTASTATSRSNRVNNRRLVNEINTQKKALESGDTDSVALRFNQLKKRRKLVRFERSAIHGWGLYAEENISANDMIIEYVGEIIRPSVAELREVKYARAGIGSSYLFRIDEEQVVDATKKGSVARFINHSCSPNCTAKIIKVEGTRRIVIYAAKDIHKGQELTYDYKFEREFESDDRVPCLCGSIACKGFLN